MKEYSILILNAKELERDVKVYIYLPSSYSESNESYPVLYLNDGQILFNDYDGYQGQSFGIMERYINNPSSKELILVGVGSTKARTNELLPYTFVRPKSGAVAGGKAKEYMDFIVNTLKPVIDSKFRTLTSPKDTGILGISVGGVCAAYAAACYTAYFSKFGCVSSAFNPVREQMVELMNKTDFSSVKKMYLDVGTNESPNEEKSMEYIESNTEIYESLQTKMDEGILQFNLIEGSQHLEEDWEKRFPSIIDFMFN